MNKFFLLTAATLLGSTTAAFAQDAAPAPTSATTVSTFDINADGTLSPLEFAQSVAATTPPAAGGVTTSAAMRDRSSRAEGNATTELLNQTAPMFAKIDTDGDMHLSASEVAAYQGTPSN